MSARRDGLIWAILVTGILAVGAVAAVSMLRPKGAPLDDLGPAPDFTLTRETGASVRRADLEGTVWMADFMYTRCRGLCPMLAQRMAALQDELKGTSGWKLVSFTVDPGFDTPPVLAAYGQEHGADPGDWIFLTGEKAVMRDLVTRGFHLAVQDSAGSEREPTLHSQRIVLVDGSGTIRGYYDALDRDAMARLAADARRLAARGGA